jgi:hypothetical protein
MDYYLSVSARGTVKVFLCALQLCSRASLALGQFNPPPFVEQYCLVPASPVSSSMECPLVTPGNRGIRPGTVCWCPDAAGARFYGKAGPQNDRP